MGITLAWEHQRALHTARRTNGGTDQLQSRLEGVDRRKLKFITLNTLQARVSVRIKSESGREGKTNQPRK
jgi:hypothetical protein